MNGMRDLEGMGAIVTGAAKNIGRAIALSLAEGGASVAVVTKSDMEGARSVAAEIGSKGGAAIALEADITDENAVAKMVEATVAKFGGVDILVNNAGVRPESPLGETSFKEWRAVQAVILDGAFLCCRAALPHLEKSGRGAIVNIGGLTAYTGAANRVHVVSAKAGLDGLTKALAVELAPRGITVNLVSPGLIDTKRGGSSALAPDHHRKHTALVGRRGKPEEVAEMVRFLAGPNGRYMTGQTIHVNGGVYLP
jgi:3-oxoacyl-[acyl-carrier protein] reductase